MEIDKKTLTACLNIAKGCHDYQGGYHGKKDNEIFHHGIQTVVNCLEKFNKNCLNDIQLKVIHEIGQNNPTNT